MKQLLILIFLILLPSSVFAVIPFTVEQQTITYAKASFFVVVDLVDNRLPNKAELEEIVNLIKPITKKNSKMFVQFSLPKMTPEQGAFAIARHKSKLKIWMIKSNLNDTPYEELSRATYQ